MLLRKTQKAKKNESKGYLPFQIKKTRVRLGKKLFSCVCPGVQRFSDIICWMSVVEFTWQLIYISR